MKKVLFLLENGPNIRSNPEYQYDRFVKYSLSLDDIESDIYLIDNPDEIQKKLEIYNPTHVVLPALWLDPERFRSIHKDSIIWILRIPKNAETVAAIEQSVGWLNSYIQCENTLISCNNNKEFLDNVRDMLQDEYEYTTQEITQKIMSCDIVMTTILK